MRDLMICLMTSGGPSVPSLVISLALFTSPYAPRPISRSITNSDILRSLSASTSELGVGGPVLAAMLRKLAALFARTSVWGTAGGGDGGWDGTIDTRPAIRETRCCEDRRRGRAVPPSRGDVGVRDNGGRTNPGDRGPGEAVREIGSGEEGRDGFGDCDRGEDDAKYDPE